MINITAIAPYEEFADLFYKTFQAHNSTPFKPTYEKEDYELEIVMATGFSDIIGKKFNTDVIVTRGGIAQYLRTHEDFAPVVEVPVSGNDLVHTLYECKQKLNIKTAAIIGTTSMIIGAERLSKIVGIDIKTFLSMDDDRIAHIVKKAMDMGFKTIIGGVRTSACANESGAEGIFIKTGQEAIWQAITEAKRAAYISRREQEKSERYKAIIDYAYEGIIALDKTGAISVFNTAARKTLKIPEEDLMGKDVEEILLHSGMKNLISSEKKTLDELVGYENIQLSVNMVPILLKGDNAGKVITFQDVSSIQEAESRIREKIHTRGHIAKHTFNDIIGTSDRIVESIDMARDFSTTDSNILIWGETGTGKELFAQSMHNFSPRRKGPFVAVNCAALPESLLESELFGYAEGAFTGAVKGGKPGLFELAHKGTIFLDEISETTLKLQGQLLRVLQEKEIRRIGHDRIIPVDVRVISASNKDLTSLVHDGLFREDLYYRLNILKINLPPLRDMGEDILLLADSFTKYYCQKSGRNEIRLSSRAKELLKKYRWPGNIRQLRNICERLVVLNKFEFIEGADVEKIIFEESFTALEANKKKLYGTTHYNEDVTPFPPKNTGSEASFKDGLKQLEKEKITAALVKSGYNKAKAGRILGMNRTTLWRRMKELGIHEPED